MNTEHRIVDASLPLYAAWSLQSPIFIAVVLIQQTGNEYRVVGSRHWKQRALHECIEGSLELTRGARLHITPHDRDGVYERQFTDSGLICEAAPELHDQELLLRRLMATLTVDPSNEDLIEAINQYAPRPNKSGFTVTPGHTLERWFVKALEVFACWHHLYGGTTGWGPAPDYTESDRAVI